MKRHLSQLGLALCATMCGLSSGAFAAEITGLPPVPEFLSTRNLAPQTLQVQAVDDDVLGQQTGKYAGGSMISGFVLNLISQWQLPNGATALAQGTLSAVQNAAGQIAATVNTLAQVTNGNGGNNGANPNAITTGGQGIAVNGVSQVTQVAGNNNLGSNAAQIDFSNTPVVLAGGNAPSAAAANSTGSIKAGITFGSNGVTVALQTPAGLATQTITPNNAQIAQLLQITGNSQQVANQLQLHLQTQQMSAAMVRQLGVLQGLQNSASSRR
ncbi:peptidase C39 [Paraburkholderia sp.]|jgi:hypothetical protein|uniref:peptidase C39 n=1 Tax=Paraburkholderia sp. TaxID=1926495 RepID=UPI002F3E4F02